MIVIVEDDKSIRDLVLYTLNNTGFEAIGFSNGKDFFKELANSIPSLLLLDVMLPEEDGISILKKLRLCEDTRKMPIIMLTAKDSEFDKIIGLDSGADDYITKPFSMLELISRVKALLRRSNDEKNNILAYKNLVLNDDAHKLTVNNEIIETTLKEYNTLKLLLQKQGKVVSRDELLSTVWGYDFDGETRTVDVHIRMLRQKLGECGLYIQTVRGVGYKIGESI